MKWWVKPYLETGLLLQKLRRKRMIDFKHVPHWFEERIKEVDFNFYVISDTHFYHPKIAEYCDRPEDCDRLIISNWNAVVEHKDIVFHLGDFAFGSKEMAKEKVMSLRGQIILLKGNHDRHGTGWYNDIGIEVIKNPFLWIGNKWRLLFSHVPQYPIDEDVINIHGHVHNIRPLIWNRQGMQYRNTSVEAMNYKPIKFKDLINGNNNKN